MCDVPVNHEKCHHVPATKSKTLAYTRKCFTVNEYIFHRARSTYIKTACSKVCLHNIYEQCHLNRRDMVTVAGNCNDLSV